MLNKYIKCNFRCYRCGTTTIVDLRRQKFNCNQMYDAAVTQWLRRCATNRQVAGSINVVLFRTRHNQELMLRDFIGFMQANKYKLYQTVKRRLLVANYLCVLDKP